MCVAKRQDPATPITSARRLANEMGDNARLRRFLQRWQGLTAAVNSIGYGHSSNADESDCSKAVIRDFILNGKLPNKAETTCHANKKPFDDGYVSALSDHIPSAWIY